MKWIFLFALAVAMPASAQSIYKCRDAKGGAVYQSDPCPEAEKRWDTEPRNYTWDDHYKRQAAEASIRRDRRAVQQRNAAQQPVAVGIGTGPRVSSVTLTIGVLASTALGLYRHLGGIRRQAGGR